MNKDLRKAAEMALEVLTLINQDIEKHRATLPIRRQPELCKASLALRKALAQHVDAVNISQERVDETAKREHEPWPSVQCVCGGTIYFKYTPPISDYHEGWEEGFKAAKCKREWVGLTDEEIIKCFDSVAFGRVEDDLIINKHVNIFRAIHGIEAKLKEKNT